MVIKPEQLLESLLDLEKSRQREREIRLETEALLEGLRNIADAQHKNELFHALLEALRNVIEFEEAFILEFTDENKMTILISTCGAVENTVWKPESVFKRVLAGRPIASFDVTQVSEWKQQPDRVKENIASALHIGLHGGIWDALLIITHSNAKHFGPTHVKKVKRFSPLASQALLTLELQQAITQRDRFFQLSMDLMAIVESDGALKQYNSVWDTLLGYEKNDITGKGLLDFVHPEDSESVETILNFLNKAGGKELLEVRFCKKSGAYLWFSCSFASYHDEQLFYIVARDITDKVIYRQRLAYEAGHDSLTGLKNRAEFIPCIKQAFDRVSCKQDYVFAIFFLDLNKFKSINDTLGHDIGDELLKTFAKVLLEVVRDMDTVARLGGDEFTILLDDVKSPAYVASVAERIQEKCLEPFNLKGHQVKASTSIGIAISTARYKNAEIMLKAADQAMYKAKSDERKNYIISE